MLVSLGLDFRQARLDVRERFHLDDADIPRIRAVLAGQGVEELVLTRTCNREELYCWWPETSARAVDPALELARAWVGGAGPRADELLRTARLRLNRGVAQHLFRVAAGLESQILGDIHILGQLRSAFREAIQAKSIGSHLHRLFETGFRVGRRVKRETLLMSNRSGVGSEVARRVAARAGELSEQRFVIIGCGKSGTHATRCLYDRGARQLTVVNRTLSAAERLAGEFEGARAAGLDELPEALVGADVVVVATGAAQPVLTRAAVIRARQARASTSRLLVIDVSVPRNAEPSIASVSGVDLVDLDTLHPESARLERSRRASVPEAEALVEQGVDDFMDWLDLEDARIALQPLREVLGQICQREVSYLIGEGSSASRTADRIVAAVMARPMSALRAASRRGELMDEATDALGTLFTSSAWTGGRDRGFSATKETRI